MDANYHDSEWTTKDVEYPNPAANGRETFGFDSRYYHVEGGFKFERWRKNAKLFVTEREIRRVILSRRLKQVRDLEQKILAELSKSQEPKE